MNNSGILSSGKVLVADVFGDNSCVREQRLEFEDVYDSDKVPGELLIETLWRKEANASFLEAGYRPITLRR